MIELSFEWLNHEVPLWVAIVSAFTSPYLWAGYVKRAASDLYGRYVGGDAE